jgi:3-oxoadipate enol-lactonase
MLTTESLGARLHYELSGPPGGTVLVMSSSIGSNLHMWDKVVAPLEKCFRVLRYDSRGHGQSMVSPSPYTIEELGNDLLALLDHLAIDIVHLCGLSLGGLVAMWIGIHAPLRVRRIVLASTAARIGTPAGWEQRIASVRHSGMDTLALSTIERWFTCAYREKHPDEMKAIHQMISATSVEGYIGCCEVLRNTDLRSDLSAIEAQLLVISGTHDPATPPSDGHALQSFLRHARYAELDASHLSAWEKPEEFAEAVLGFLEEEERTDG